MNLALLVIAGLWFLFSKQDEQLASEEKLDAESTSIR